MRKTIRQGEAAKAAGMVDAFIKEHKLDDTTKQQVLVSKVGACVQAKRFDDAVSTIEQIIAIAPDSPVAAQAKEFLPEAKKMQEEARKGK